MVVQNEGDEVQAEKALAAELSFPGALSVRSWNGRQVKVWCGGKPVSVVDLPASKRWRRWLAALKFINRVRWKSGPY